MDPFVPTPQPVRWRRGVYAVALVVPFTVAQVWALLVLLRLAPLDGVVGQAFLVTFAGSAAAVWAGWRWAWRLGSEPRRSDRRPERESARHPAREPARERAHYPDRESVHESGSWVRA
ncbi:hypothetical protein [Amycolatopsis jiangsuensis]|uniref:Uncharacterized protein n=1 Tax=Amycolatopsis jiangsuensis TaxID=1181879 RepID=A0A840IT26_9PSEU|nr:hypothetical protein [Amycolatopsis jiangsuensis]MBB4684615.1 hypothetical protein [Amycolatopsis jiangsuensis]